MITQRRTVLTITRVYLGVYRNQPQWQWHLWLSYRGGIGEVVAEGVEADGAFAHSSLHRRAA